MWKITKAQAPQICYPYVPGFSSFQSHHFNANISSVLPSLANKASWSGQVHIDVLLKFLINMYYFKCSVFENDWPFETQVFLVSNLNAQQ